MLTIPQLIPTSYHHHLNRSGLHLNAKGTAQLASNFIKFLKLRGDKKTVEQESDEDMLSREPCKYTFSYGKPSKCLNSFSCGFVVASLNINNLLTHIDDLKIFVTNSKIDILAINKTKLDSSISDFEIYLPGFKVVRRDFPVNGRCGGSVCIY